MKDKIYLGDSVYAQNDGYGIILTTENGHWATNTIYLEPSFVVSNYTYNDNTSKQHVNKVSQSIRAYGVSVNELQPEVITFGISEYRMLSQQLKMCLDADYFPSYQHRSINGSFDVFLPSYIESV